MCHRSPENGLRRLSGRRLFPGGRPDPRSTLRGEDFQLVTSGNRDMGVDTSQIPSGTSGGIRDGPPQVTSATERTCSGCWPPSSSTRMAANTCQYFFEAYRSELRTRCS